MQNLDFQPKMIGRENELSELRAYLDRAVGGEGSTIFISGEAGIGKTRLVNELKQIAQEGSFQILSGNCMYESLTPFMPITEALRSGGLESLFAEEAPKVEAVYLITHSGLLIKDIVRQETKLDSDLFSSVITTLSEFASQSLSKLLGEKKEGTLNSVGFGNYRILIESRKNMNLVVIISGKENEFLINDMREIFSKVNKSYGDILENWDGDEENVKGIEKFIEPLITSGKYDGIYYGKGEPKIRRNLLFENVSLGINRLAQEKPALLCIEDLQWADPSTLVLMHYIARNSRKNRLIILGSYRPEDIIAVDGKDHPLMGIMQMMDREDLYKKMELTRLSERNMDEFLIALLKKTDFTDEFIEQIYKETEGNPLFVIQLIKYMIDEKIILEFERVWKMAKDPKDIEIPSKIYHVIERRLNRLDKEDRKVLDYACVIGEIFNSSILTVALGMKRTQLLERLRGLEQAHRLIYPQNGNFKFDHAKIKEVLYTEIPKELRINYHSIIANSIERMNKDNLDEVVGDLAFHYYQSKNKDKALYYLMRAAEKAKRDYSNQEAIRFYREALEFEEDAQKRIEILEDLGILTRTIGDFEKSFEIYENLLKLVKNKRKKARIKTIIGRLKLNSGKWDELLKIATEALELLNGEECKEEAYIHRLIGIVQMFQGNIDQAFENHLKSLEIAKKFGDQLAIALSYEGLGHASWYKGDYKKSLEAHEKSLMTRKKMGQEWEVQVALGNIGWAYIGMEDYNKAMEYFEESLKIQQKVGEFEGLSYTWWGFAEIYYGKGDLKEASKFMNRAYDLSKEIDFKEVIAESYLMFGKIYREQKKWEESVDNFEKSLIGFDEGEMKIRFGDAHFEYGLMWKARGDFDKTKKHFQKALDIFEELKIEKKMEKVKVVLEDMKIKNN